MFSRKASVAEADVGPASGKRGKREARRRRSSAAQLRKVLPHNPETYAQFQSLGLNPPLTVGGVAETQAKLQEKMEELEHKAAMVKLSRLSVQQEATGMISSLDLVPEAPEVHQVLVVPSKTDSSVRLLQSLHETKSLQELSELGNDKAALFRASSMVEEEPSIKNDTFFDLKPETRCDTIDLANGSNNVPAILLSPASNESTGNVESSIQDQLKNLDHCNNVADKEIEEKVENIEQITHNASEEENDGSPREEISNVGPLIQVTDCDTEKSNSSGLIAASCIIAR